MTLLAVVVVSPTRLTRYVEISDMFGKVRRRASTGDTEGSVEGVLGVPTSSCPHSKQSA